MFFEHVDLSSYKMEEGRFPKGYYTEGSNPKMSSKGGIYIPGGDRGGGSMEYLKEGSSREYSAIITVPHAAGCEGEKPDPKVYPPSCETNAEMMADMLRNALFQQKVYLYGIFHAEKPRSEIDLNNRAAIMTDYRLSIIYAIRKELSYRDVVWVIDVHSFSPEHRSHFTSGDSKFIIIDTWEDGKETDYVSRMVEYINRPSSMGSSMGSRVEVIKGIDPTENGENDIMNTSRKYGARSFLIAVEEGLPQHVYYAMSLEIADFIRQDSYIR